MFTIAGGGWKQLPADGSNWRLAGSFAGKWLKKTGHKHIIKDYATSIKVKRRKPFFSVGPQPPLLIPLLFPHLLFVITGRLDLRLPADEQRCGAKHQSPL